MKQSSFKELVRLVLGQPFRMSLMLVGTVVQVLLTVYLPILIGQAVDAVLIADGQVLLGIIGKMVMLILLNTLVQWYLPLVTNRLVYGMVAACVLVELDDLGHGVLRWNCGGCFWAVRSRRRIGRADADLPVPGWHSRHESARHS